MAIDTTISLEQLKLELNALLKSGNKEMHELPLLKVGDMLALIEVDTTKTPFQIWHYDLNGRKALPDVERVITDFLNTSFQNANSSIHFQDVSRPHRPLGYLTGGSVDVSREGRDIDTARRHLREAQETDRRTHESVPKAAEAVAQTYEQRRFWGLFKFGKTESNQNLPSNKTNKPIKPTGP